jgi:hypothetical protein
MTQTRPIRSLPPAPAQTLGDLVQLCDGWMPISTAEARRDLFMDLDSVRGGARLAALESQIRRKVGGRSIHLVSGHIGSGKTSELYRLAESLEKDRGPREPGLTVLWVDADQTLSQSSVDLEDLVLAVVEALLALDTKAAAQALKTFWTNNIKKALVASLVDLPGVAAASLDAPTGLLEVIRIGTREDQERIRQVLRGTFVNQLIGALNRAFDELSKESGNGDIAVVIDNLEKVVPMDPDLLPRLFIQRMPMLKALDAHLILTTPLELATGSQGGGIRAALGCTPVVLPMIKLSEPQSQKAGARYEPGYAAMRALLRRRVDIDRLFADPADVDGLIEASAGSVRSLLRMVSDAANNVDDPPITTAAVRRVIALETADFQRTLRTRWVPWLHQIADTNQWPADLPENDQALMLRDLYVLEYQNGDPFPWADVHPLVKRCPAFRNYAPAP